MAIPMEYIERSEEITGYPVKIRKRVHQDYPGRFWKDNPYKMMGALGYRFYTGDHTGDYSLGLHFDAYPPGFDPEERAGMEFWITVIDERVGPRCVDRRT